MARALCAEGIADVTPYYATPDGSIQIYHTRWEDVRDAGLLVGVSFVWADAPYGQKEDTRRAAKGRGLVDRPHKAGSSRLHGGLVKARDFPAVHGDNAPFDPAPILSLNLPTVLWGAQRYASRLPDSPSWLWWDKREDSGPDDNGDGEMAWTNLGGPPRQFSHLWRGTCRASEVGVPHIHPTQKPAELSTWGLMHAMARKKLKPGDTVLSPYAGSCPEIESCVKLGLRLIACDVEELYCRTMASARLGAVPHPEPVDRLGPLFGGV